MRSMLADLETMVVGGHPATIHVATPLGSEPALELVQAANEGLRAS
jgi:hypothetical protein